MSVACQTARYPLASNQRNKRPSRTGTKKPGPVMLGAVAINAFTSSDVSPTVCPRRPDAGRVAGDEAIMEHHPRGALLDSGMNLVAAREAMHTRAQTLAIENVVDVGLAYGSIVNR